MEIVTKTISRHHQAVNELIKSYILIEKGDNVPVGWKSNEITITIIDAFDKHLLGYS